VPLYSAYTGGPLAPETAVDPAFWAAQPVTPVLFWPTLDRILSEEDRVLVETGPSQSLTVSARGHGAVRAGHSTVVATLPPRALGPGEDRRSVRAARESVLTAAHSGRLPLDLPAS
jgi:acyl transferase domain-containing protein